MPGRVIECFPAPAARGNIQGIPIPPGSSGRHQGGRPLQPAVEFIGGWVDPRDRIGRRGGDAICQRQYKSVEVLQVKKPVIIEIRRIRTRQGNSLPVNPQKSHRILQVNLASLRTIFNQVSAGKASCQGRRILLNAKGLLPQQAGLVNRSRVTLVGGKEIPVIQVKADRLALGFGSACVGKNNPRLGKDPLERSPLRESIFLDRGKGPHQHAAAIAGKICGCHQAADIHGSDTNERLYGAPRGAAGKAVHAGRTIDLGDEIESTRGGMNDQGLVIVGSGGIAKTNRLRPLRDQALVKVH